MVLVTEDTLGGVLGDLPLKASLGHLKLIRGWIEQSGIERKG